MAGAMAGVAAGGATLSGCIFHHGAKGNLEADPTPVDRQSASATYFPPLKGDGWEKAAPASLNWDERKLSDLLDYLGVYLADNGYDLRKLIEHIATSRT